ncbi:hypothetical protein WB66_02375 [bacteria symbiont BFo1 of Frankliniella occidentalis]|jgi:O-antigen ligase|uniref:O-antigen ligase family protein n=1 Tax=Erwinia aphidicola TaxID=68334 RepID=UPI000789E6F8|nr:O-antigen ligase family protein [Erwinia aphidicola]KYP86000.1 hypothetical protein WB66_02375 [bacteria symbiont BFo1 of Frankliniella occidentalis]KYP88269.1 hypothetical protein WB91_18170 [bacteria symbiont BFo1 of Frankliniella occidentalis]MBD1375306.1 O-antigen ligase family protein [Erwinia aphidicola]
MNIDIKDNNIFAKLINVAVVFLSTSLALNLVTYGISQKLFYLTGYICAFLTVMVLFKKEERKEIDFFTYLLVLALIFIGVVRVAWVVYIQSEPREISDIAAGVLDGYRLSGKRLFLGAFIVAAMMIYGRKVSKKTVSCVKVILLIGMIVTLVAGFYEYFYVTHRRIKLTADAASSSSYMVMFIYCAYLWLCGFHFGKLWRLIDVVFIAVAFLVMVLCGTRITFLAFMGVTFLYYIKALGWRNIIYSKRNIALAVCLMTVVISFTQARWIEAINNIDNYDVNSSTSVGARFSIWASGVNFIEKNIGFSSPDERTEVSRKYIHHIDPKNHTAYNNVEYNMHNEFLEVTSLQGLLGFASLFIFYLVVLVGKFKHSPLHGVVMPVAALFITGLTDSVLIYGPTAMVFVSALALCSINSERKMME